MLTETDVARIRQGLREGIVGPLVLTWVERLLADRDERIERDRAIAVQLLTGAPPRPPPRRPSGDRSVAPRRKRPVLTARQQAPDAP